MMTPERLTKILILCPVTLREARAFVAYVVLALVAARWVWRTRWGRP